MCHTAIAVEATLRHYETVSEVKRLGIYNGYMQWQFPDGHKCPFGCDGCVCNGHAVYSCLDVSAGVLRRLWVCWPFCF
jgi:hypothetical protein